MKHMKMLGFAAVAAMVLTAFLGAGSASATVLCKTASNPCPAESRYPAGTALDASLTAGTSVIWEAASTPTDTCSGSTFTAKSTSAGSAFQTVLLKVESLIFSNCVATADVLTLGELEVHWITGTHNGTLTARGWSGTAANCTWNYTEWTHVGTIKGGNPATIEISMPIAPLCAFVTRMTASYTVTAPKPLYVEGS
jgi:hypothetical protein